jgi:hypothetical protein
LPGARIRGWIAPPCGNPRSPDFKRILIGLACLIAACGNPQTGGSAPEGPATNEPADVPTTTVVIDTNDVAKFRGTTMAQLLKTMEGPDEGRWHYVRRHVVPRPLQPVDERDGKIVKVNYDWPPQDPNKLTPPQKAWRSYLLWPEHVRELLSSDKWAEEATRDRLARIGRAYELTWKFHQVPEFKSRTLESEHWRTYAESMLAYGDDGRSLLVSNMILALTNPSEDVIANAKSVLVFVGEPAIEQLCAAMWIGHRQRAVLDSGEYYVQINADFNRHVMETLFNIGPRALPRAVSELENSLDANGKATGTGWRFRRYFVELIGRFGSVEYLRTLEAEIDRVEVVEYDSAALAQGILGSQPVNRLTQCLRGRQP